MNKLQFLDREYIKNEVIRVFKNSIYKPFKFSINLFNDTVWVYCNILEKNKFSEKRINIELQFTTTNQLKFGKVIESAF
jgi:hypothetical protein